MTPLPPASALRVYRILTYLVGGEGPPDPRELAVLARFRDQHAIPRDAAAAMDRDALETGRLELAKDADERAALIEALIDVVASDGCLDHEEQERLRRLAEHLRIPQQELAARLLERLTGP